jgi:hypothetical protein
MPNRILRDWTDSLRVDVLGFQSEVLFTRLIMKVDDYGRFSANPKLVKSLCFPLKDGVRDADITRWLAECEKAGLIVVYAVKGRTYLQIEEFRQRSRAEKSKFPDPSEKDDVSPANDGQATVNGPSAAHVVEGGDVVEGERRRRAPAPASPLSDGPVVEAWNAEGSLPKIQSMTDKRRSALKTRMSEPFFRENYAEGIRRAAKSAFCTGTNERGWKATFDWFLQPDSLTRIMEGKYEGKKGSITLPLRPGEEPPVFDPGTE